MEWPMLEGNRLILFLSILSFVLLIFTSICISYIICNKSRARKLALQNDEVAKKLRQKINALENAVCEYDLLEIDIKDKNDELEYIKQNINLYHDKNDKIQHAIRLLNNNLRKIGKKYREALAVINSLTERRKALQEIEFKLKLLADKEREADIKIQKIEDTLDLYERIENFERYGLFAEPSYIFQTSEKYANEIKNVRNEQKELIKNDKAVLVDSHLDTIPFYYIDKDCSAYKRLILRSFNIECDYLIGKVNPGNFERTMRRIGELAKSLESDIKNVNFYITDKYIELKCQECLLQYQFKLKKKREQEEQRVLREKIREEAKARKEYEKAIADAQKDENRYEQMLDDARKSMQMASREEKEKLLYHIKLLEDELADARSKAERAKSMAEQTRKGYVYIISNIGSFGKDVVKIGLTRRLDPTERVRELGDASVPFIFDIHAMIASDDAPALETALHKAFAHKRVNAVNMRKEFFRVSLDEVRQKVQEITGDDKDFVMTVTADDYYQTQRLQHPIAD